MKSASQHSFAQVPRVEIPRSAFKRDSTYKTTFNAGYLVPIYVDEVLPGDTFNVHLTQFARLQSPLKYPLMDNLFMDTHFFFVPNRLLWEHWQNCMGERPANHDYENDTDYLCPTTSAPSGGWSVNSIADYFGLPIGVDNLTVNALPFRAYNKIFNDWYRDENLVSAVTESVGDGPDAAANFALLRRCKRHDYFTSALPWPQKGPGVELPLGTTAPVAGNGLTLGLTDGTGTGGLIDSVSLGLSNAQDVYGKSAGSTPTGLTFATGTSVGVTTDPAKSGLVADLSSASAATINSLREAFQLQRMYERDARGGSRYIELIKSHFGVTSPDARLQRSEYLGGGSTPIQIHTVASTNGAAAASPTGNSGTAQLSAYGVTASSNVGFSKSFVEHGIIIGIASVRADMTYQQGIPRMFSRIDRFDFYWPALSHLGEQAILNKEIYAQGSTIKDSDGNVIDDKVFGYQERFGEYRYGISKITGMFRSSAGTSLDVYHLAQDFATLPTLSSTFIQENPPVDRVLAFGSTVSNQFLYDSLISVNCVRPMPLFGVPGMMDHF